MKDIMIFNNQNFGEIRVVEIDGEPWLVAKDVCDCLEIKNSRDALSRLDEDEKNTVVLTDGTPGNPERSVVNEYGLFNLILSSRKPEAKEFKRWVTHDVLPSIRKTGRYDLSQSDYYIPKNYPDALRLAADQQEKIEKMQKQIETKNAKVIPYLMNADHRFDLQVNILKQKRNNIERNFLPVVQSFIRKVAREVGFTEEEFASQAAKSYSAQTGVDFDMYQNKNNAELEAFYAHLQIWVEGQGMEELVQATPDKGELDSYYDYRHREGKCALCNGVFKEFVGIIPLCAKHVDEVESLRKAHKTTWERTFYKKYTLIMQRMKYDI